LEIQSPYFLSKLLHGTGPFLKSKELFMQSKIPRISQKTNVHYRIYNSPSLVPILNQTNAVQAFSGSFSKINFYIILVSTSEPSKPPPHNTMHFSSPSDSCDLI